MAFRKLMIVLDKNISETTLSKLTLNHPGCVEIKILSRHYITAKYRSPLDVARIMEQSKDHYYRVCFAEDDPFKTSYRTLTIYKNLNMAFGVIEKNRGRILYQDSSIIVIKFCSFLKTCKTLHKFDSIGVRAKFTTRKVIKKIQSLRSF